MGRDSVNQVEMKLEERKLSILIKTQLGDLTSGLEQMGIALNNIDKKAKLNGWATAQTNELKLLELATLKTMAQKAVEGGIESAGVLGTVVSDADGDYDKPFTWIATGNSKGGICPTCEDLHDTVKPMIDWLDFGLPGSAPTLCTVHCVCDLIPTDEAVKNPVLIKREPKGKLGGKGKLIAVYEKSDKRVALPKDLQ